MKPRVMQQKIIVGAPWVHIVIAMLDTNTMVKNDVSFTDWLNVNSAR